MIGEVKTWEPILPSQEELQENSRSRPAKLRVFIKKNQVLVKKSLSI